MISIVLLHSFVIVSGGSVGVITVIINFGSVALSVKYYIYSSLKIILKCTCLILATSSDIRRGYVNAKAYTKRINYWNFWLIVLFYFVSLNVFILFSSLQPRHIHFPAIIHLFKVSSRYTIKRCEIFSVPTDVINLCGKIRIRKSRHYGGQAM